MQSRHSAEVSKLQKHIDDLDNQVIRMQMTVVKAASAATGGHQPGNRWVSRLHSISSYHNFEFSNYELHEE